MTLEEAKKMINDVKSYASNVIGAMNDCEKGKTDQIEEARSDVQRMNVDLQALDEFFSTR